MNNKEIRIVNVTTVGIGGAYRAVERLNSAINECTDISSSILLRNKAFSDNVGEEILDNPIKTFISKTKNFINILFSSGDISRDLLGSDILRHELVQNADVIVIHWINSFLSYATMKKVMSLGKPVVIFLHDMWHFTGGCHSDGYCGQYTSGCMNCPLERPFKRIAKKNLSDKEALYKDVKVVSPSEEYLKLAHSSLVFKNNDIVCIGNTVDTALYTSINKEELYSKYNLDSSVPIVLFTADTAGKQNANKGFDILVRALRRFKKNEIFLLILGNIAKEDMEGVLAEYSCWGYVHDEKKMIEAYNLADVTVVPSLQESFCYSVCESMACGTPVVAFPVGGIKDQIDHLENGYLARFKDEEDLANGIRFCIENKEKLSDYANDKAQTFSYSSIAAKWKMLIKYMVEGK